MDIQSILGYSKGSPFSGNPYIDIQSNIIDMSNTPIDLLGIDNLGNEKKMKAGRKKPYKFQGRMVREIPMQAGGVFTSQAEIDKANQFARDLLTRQNAPAFLASNSYVARKIGDPIPQIVGGQATAPRATTLPRGVSINDVMNTKDGYGYIDPTYGNWVAVDPQSVYSLYGQKKPTPSTTMTDVAKFGKGGRNPYMQKGGYSLKDLYSYILGDEGEDDENYTNTENTAPAEDELPQQQQVEQQEPDDYEMALKLAMQQDNYETVSGNPYLGSGAESYVPRVTGSNPYTSTPSSTVDNPAKYAYQFLQKKGLPSHVAAGIVGNLIQESGNFRPDVISDDIKGDNGMSHGIAQWQKGRWPAFLQWANSQGKDPKQLDTQLEYVYVEANQRGDLQKTLLAQTPEEAANIFAKHYERPAFIDKNRARNARQLYQQK